jgi:hypothetical protein
MEDSTGAIDARISSELSENESRFASLGEEELQLLLDGRLSKCTKQTISFVLNILSEYSRAKGKFLVLRCFLPRNSKDRRCSLFPIKSDYNSIWITTPFQKAPSNWHYKWLWVPISKRVFRSSLDPVEKTQKEFCPTQETFNNWWLQQVVLVWCSQHYEPDFKTRYLLTLLFIYATVDGKIFVPWEKKISRFALIQLSNDMFGLKTCWQKITKLKMENRVSKEKCTKHKTTDVHSQTKPRVPRFLAKTKSNVQQRFQSTMVLQFFSWKEHSL